MSNRRQHLALVPAAGTPALRGREAQTTLRGAPWRPGELPGALPVFLDDYAAATANAAARERRVPVELWLRATIDGARVLDELAREGERAGLARALDGWAHETLAELGPGGPLASYALALARGEPQSVTTVGCDGRVELCLPADLELGWRRAAAASGESLTNWAASRAMVLAGEPLYWEAAASARGQRLAEWSYAVLLSASSPASAWPQPRT